MCFICFNPVYLFDVNFMLYQKNKDKKFLLFLITQLIINYWNKDTHF